MRNIVPKSGYYYPNKIGRIYLQAMEEVMGRNGLNALLNLTGLRQYIQEFPPDNLEREFDFSDFSNLNKGLDDIYGPRGGRGLALRGGRATFARGLKGFGALAGVGDLAFKVLPLATKVKIGLPAMARVFSQFSDQVTRVESFDDHHLYYIDRCPVCWGRESDRQICYVAVGLLQEGLRWVSGGLEFRVEELECIAAGAPACTFKIDKEPIK
ncbi:MAG: 4-vinyl reductase [Chloroflexi bacterium]|nr:4-vinyl reductase [Chloroflexota bacterium]MCI0643992.1 4-vinyl reductase [Chloroflexota bacterium]MCI0732009.1 4-vinyl reductase [Chloroflexota bacterium]